MFVTNRESVISSSSISAPVVLSILLGSSRLFSFIATKFVILKLHHIRLRYMIAFLSSAVEFVLRGLMLSLCGFSFHVINLLIDYGAMITYSLFG